MKQIIFFDGACIFCNSFAHFVAKRDQKFAFKFCALQDRIALDFAKKFNFESEIKNLDGLVFVKGDRVFKKSDAAIEIVSNLGFPHSFIRILKIIPQKIRDYFYDYFGKNRYKWFGKKDLCEINNSEISARILTTEDISL